MEPRQFVAFALRVVENPQQHIQRIHHDPLSTDPLDVPAHDRQQALNVEIAGDDFFSGQASLDDGHLAGLLQGRQVPAHRRRVQADGLGPLFKCNEHAGLTRHRPAAKKLQAQHRLSGARPATDHRGPASGKSALQDLIQAGNFGWHFRDGLPFSAHGLLFSVNSLPLSRPANPRAVAGTRTTLNKKSRRERMPLKHSTTSAYYSTGPSRSDLPFICHPTAILIGAIHGPETLLCYNLIVLCRKKGNKWVLSDTGSLGNHAFPPRHGLRTDLLT